MGKASSLKVIRRQLRNIYQENHETVMKSEVVGDISTNMAKLVNDRMDTLAKNVDKQLEVADQQTNTFRSYVLRECASQISNELANISATMLAWQRTLTTRLGVNTTEIEAEVQTAKAAILAEMQAEAQRRADEEAAAALAASAQAKQEVEAAAAAAQTEQPNA